MKNLIRKMITMNEDYGDDYANDNDGSNGGYRQDDQDDGDCPPHLDFI